METITKHIGEGFARGELYACLAYDSTDQFGGKAVKQIRFNPTSGATAIIIGDSTTAITLATYAQRAISIYTTCASTDGSNTVLPVYINATMSGTGGVGRAFEAKLTVSGKLGSWGNALKGYTDLTGGTGSAGLISAVCAEMKMSASGTLGTFGVVELELVCPTSWTSGAGVGTNCISLIYAQVSGTTASQFDTNGFYLNLQGHTAAAGKFVSLTSQTLKCAISASTRYLVLSQTEDGLGLGTSGTPQVVTYDGAKPLSIYTTCASTSATSYEPVLFYTTLTGIGQTGGRVRAFMTANVALGGWSNALKGEVTYGATGRTTGLGSAICAEMTMSAGTSSGTYAPLEIELNMGASGVTGTATSLMYMSINDAAATAFDTSGYIMDIAGVSVASGKVFQVNTAAAATHALRIRVAGTAYYMMLTSAGA